MKNSKSILSILLLSICNLFYSQINIVNELKILTKKSSATHTSEVYFNEDLTILEIDGYSFPLKEIELEFKNDLKTLSGINIVGFLNINCADNSNCIIKNNQSFSSVGIPFINKKDAYEAINIIAKLKKHS